MNIVKIKGPGPGLPKGWAKTIMAAIYGFEPEIEVKKEANPNRHEIRDFPF